jgi:hypothetical protein
MSRLASPSDAWLTAVAADDKLYIDAAWQGKGGFTSSGTYRMGTVAGELLAERARSQKLAEQRAWLLRTAQKHKKASEALRATLARIQGISDDPDIKLLCEAVLDATKPEKVHGPTQDDNQE